MEEGDLVTWFADDNLIGLVLYNGERVNNAITVKWLVNTNYPAHQEIKGITYNWYRRQELKKLRFLNGRR